MARAGRGQPKQATNPAKNDSSQSKTPPKLSNEEYLQKLQREREITVAKEYKNIRRETIAHRRSTIASHAEFKQQLKSLITKSVEIKQKHQKQHQRLLDREFQAREHNRREERSMQLRIQASKTPAIPALEATVEVTTYDMETDTSSTETVANPLIVKDDEERAASQAVIDSTPQPVKDHVNG